MGHGCSRGHLLRAIARLRIHLAGRRHRVSVRTALWFDAEVIIHGPLNPLLQLRYRSVVCTTVSTTDQPSTLFSFSENSEAPLSPGLEKVVYGDRVKYPGASRQRRSSGRFETRHWEQPCIKPVPRYSSTDDLARYATRWAYVVKLPRLRLLRS